MKVGMEVTGVEEALERMDQEIAQIENLSQAGLWEAGLKVMGSAQRRLQDSVVTGNLRASGYVRSSSQTERPDAVGLDEGKNEPIPSDSLTPIGVELGFTADYAIYAHEILTGRAPKFLENVLVENEREIISIVKKRSNADG